MLNIYERFQSKIIRKKLSESVFLFSEIPKSMDNISDDVINYFYNTVTNSLQDSKKELKILDKVLEPDIMEIKLDLYELMNLQDYDYLDNKIDDLKCFINLFNKDDVGIVDYQFIKKVSTIFSSPNFSIFEYEINPYLNFTYSKKPYSVLGDMPFEFIYINLLSNNVIKRHLCYPTMVMRFVSYLNLQDHFETELERQFLTNT